MNNQLHEETEETTNPFALLSSCGIDQKRLQAAGRLSLDMITHIETEIENKKITVKETKVTLSIPRKNSNSNPDPPLQNSTSREEHSKSKKHFRESEHQGSQVEVESTGGMRHSRSEKKYFKSEMTQEDMQKIKRIKIMQKKYEMELQNKARLYEQNLKKFHEEEKELLERERKEKNQERLREVAKKIAQIRMRQSQRSRKMEEEKAKLSELKKEKKLYERLDEQYRTVELQEEKKKEEIKLAIKKQKNLNFQDIRQHEKKYEEIIRAQKEDRQKRINQLPRTNSKKYFQSRILKDVIREEEKLKAEHHEKKQSLYERYNKQREYADYVRENHMPYAPPKEEDKDKTTPPTVPADKTKLGNEYMKQVHESLSNLKGSSVSKVVSEKKDEPFKYKDYLKEMRGERKWSAHKQSRYLQQIDNLMKKEHMTQQQKFYKAKILAQQLQDGKGRNSQKLISSINAKLHLLKSIEPQPQ